MKREFILTADGSSSVAIPQLDLTYHSRHGAIQESMHVYIEGGLKYLFSKTTEPVLIFEMGFGTGLNAFLTAIEAEKHQRRGYYTSIEPYPLKPVEALQLNYGDLLNKNDHFLKLHESNWEEEIPLNPFFTFQKRKTDFTTCSTSKKFNLIYYDAFAPAAQPELWTVDIFQKLYNLLLPGGILVTYSAKGSVRRAMKTAGLQVTKLPGPKGKREMLRAEKTAQVCCSECSQVNL